MELLEQVELLGRLALAALLAGVLGWERQLGQQPAGLRTHMLVSIGAAAFTLAGTYGVSGLGTVQDAGRIAAQIVTGIGFIGAGTIWRSSGNERVIRGLTTAASIWVAASIGMLCGYGLYVLAAGCAGVSFVVLRLLRGLERLPGLLWYRFTARARRRREAELHPPVAADAEADGVTTAVLDGQADAAPAEPAAEADGRPTRVSERKRGGKKARKRGRRTQSEDMISD